MEIKSKNNRSDRNEPTILNNIIRRTNESFIPPLYEITLDAEKKIINVKYMLKAKSNLFFRCTIHYDGVLCITM